MEKDFLVKPKPSKLRETRSIWNEIYEWLDCAAITVLCIILCFTFFLRQVRIDGSSMEDTLYNDERVVLSNVFYTPKCGDIVVISSEVYDNTPIIKRVIATEGQYVDIRDGQVYVGDTADSLVMLKEEYVGGKYTAETVGARYGSHEYPLLVSENKVFVLGDNRTVSLDSRTKVVGMIDKDEVLGKVLIRVYPFGKFGRIDKNK